MKISILSVAPPYRGGIAEQTYHMSLHLKKTNDINVINFKRQYPGFLFPGKTQYDENSLKYELENNYRLIDSINPINWINTAKFIIKKSPDLIILRFWNPFFSISYASIIKRIKKALPSTKIIAVCDNIIPHEQNFFDQKLINLLFSKIDGFIVMSNQVKNELLDINPNAKYKKLFHPIIIKQKTYNKELAKNTLKINSHKVILFFGFIRAYKGLDILIRANQELSSRLKDYKIIISGECYGDKKKYINMIAKFSKNNEIQWIDEYVSEDLSSMYFAASDVVVLPYNSASQSGVIPLAYSYERPAIASDIPGIREMIADKKTGLLFEKGNHYDLSNKIIEFYDSEVNYKDNIIDFRNKFSWEYFNQGILDFYEEL